MNFTCILFIGTAKKLASSGYGVFALDYPGFGLSDGLHGYITSFDSLVDDVIEHFSKLKGTNSEFTRLSIICNVSLFLCSMVTCSCICTGHYLTSTLLAHLGHMLNTC